MDIGVDGWLNDAVFAGAALLLDFPEYRSHDADLDARRVGGTVYGGAWLPGEVELSLFAAYADTRHDGKRNVLGERYSASFNSGTFSVGGNIGRSFCAAGDAAFLRPFAAYDYSHLHVRGYGEPPGLYALRYRSTGYDLHRARAGVDFGWLFDSGAWIGGQAWYQGLYGDRQARTTASFILDPQARTFTSRGDAMDRHSLGLGARAGMPITANASVQVDYSWLRGRRDRRHTADITVAVQF